jgi:hypothetical protein
MMPFLLACLTSMPYRVVYVHKIAVLGFPCALIRLELDPNLRTSWSAQKLDTSDIQIACKPHVRGQTQPSKHCAFGRFLLMMVMLQAEH